MKRIIFLLSLVTSVLSARAIDLSKATIVYTPKDAALVKHMATVLAEDIERVSGIKPTVSTSKGKGENIVLTTAKYGKGHKELRNAWERYAIDTEGNTLSVTGSDARGLAYGVFHISETIGVNPWYWWADVPCDASKKAVCFHYTESFTSQEPTIKYRGLFINDEDWGLKTWSSRNFEKELGDIGPKTYDKVCELILRLKGNMLAPAMHTCTGAFYTHPESQEMADKWGIMITTSHCEPMLVNNASLKEWDTKVDGEWNWETNKEAIVKKFDSRLNETAPYHNIYTTGLRGLHDAAMKGSKDNKVRARTLENVFAEQRRILEKYKGQKAADIPQIFIPYKEALDIYDAGLRVPDDITLVWPDDNYGYMKRVSNETERKRSGHSGLYYHISYLGTPHDYLWIPSTAPMLMYEELLKAYTSGADRYWLLNVGDIKPMEIETQMFFDMAYDFGAFSYDNANKSQAEWLAGIFGAEYKQEFQYILDNYYRLAWDRKPEFMGYEIEWDSEVNGVMHDTDFSFETGTAQKRLWEYTHICEVYQQLEKKVPEALRPALFEMLGYSVLSAREINKKFLYAQANHETGSRIYANYAQQAHDEIERLRVQYNSMLNGKWNHMISELPHAFRAKYPDMPQLVDAPTDAYKLPKDQLHPEFEHKIDLSKIPLSDKKFQLLEGIGTDWVGLQMGQALDSDCKGSIDISIPSNELRAAADSIMLCISVVPLWPVSKDGGNNFMVSVDNGKPVVCQNKFKEWGYEWKLQVLENRKEFVLSLPLDKSRSQHTLTLGIVDPGQIIQEITYK